MTNVPDCISAKRKYHFRFDYVENGEIKNYSKKIGGKLCDDLLIGQDLKLKADLSKKIFLYENEGKRVEIYTSGILFFAGTIFIVLGLIRKNFKSNSTQHHL